MAESQAAYHHANSLTVLNGEQEWILNGRMADIVRKLLLANDDIVAEETVRITIHCGSKVRVEVPRRY